MKLKLTLCLATLALGIASAASTYSVTLTSDMAVGTTQLKAGDYKIAVTGNQAIFKKGKETTEVPVTVEKTAKKFQYTTMQSVNSKVQAIELGGTNMKLVVTPVTPTGTQPVGQ